MLTSQVDRVLPLGQHRLSTDALNQIFTCSADTDILNSLASAQHSRRLLLLRAVVNEVSSQRGAVDQLGSIEDAWRVLTNAERIDRRIVADLVTHPSTGVWLVRVLQLLRGRSDNAMPLWVEVGYLHSIALAAAIRTKISCSIRVPVTDGGIAIPTVGVFRIAESSSVQVVELQCTDGEIDIRPLDAVHRHRAEADGQVLEIELDDITPYREFSSRASPLRVSADELARWHTHLNAAWRALVRYHSRPATELAGVLRTVVPTSRPLIASSSALAFGAVVASMPISSVAFADTLVHEVRHSQLNAVAELVDLTCGDGVFYAPWREEPRPLLGLLHGIHAFAGSVEFWSTQRQYSTGLELREATFLFAYRRAQVREAIDAVVDTPYLTNTGRMLVKSAAERIDTCDEHLLPNGVSATVDQIMSDHRARWRPSHL